MRLTDKDVERLNTRVAEKGLAPWTREQWERIRTPKQAARAWAESVERWELDQWRLADEDARYAQGAGDADS